MWCGSKDMGYSPVDNVHIWVEVCCVCVPITFTIPRYGIFQTSINHIFATTTHIIKIVSESNYPILTLPFYSSLGCYHHIFSSYPASCIFHIMHLRCLFTLQKIISSHPLHISSKLFQIMISPSSYSNFPAYGYVTT